MALGLFFLVLIYVMTSFTYDLSTTYWNGTPSLPTSIQWTTYSTTVSPQGCQKVENHKLNITWMTTKSGECTVSYPICLNYNLELANRCCYDGFWAEEPSCYQIQETPPPCPNGYSYHETKEQCYTFTEMTTFPPRCDNGNVVPFLDSMIILDELEYDPVWMPVARDYSNGFGFYVWTELTDKYKTYFILNASVTIGSDLENDCFVYVNGSMNSVSCQEYHKAICAYQRLDVGDSYCSQRLGSCKPQHYLNHTKCFCNIYSGSGEVGQLQGADLLYPFQNSIAKVLTTEDCLIGLERNNESNDYVWVNSNTSLSYGNWAPNANFSEENIYGFTTLQGWILQRDMSDAKCVIYEREVDKTEPSLHLWFNEKSKLFELAIENKVDLKTFSGGLDPIVFCFTDASDVPEIIYRYILYGEHNYNFSFSPVQKGPGHYWCEAIRYADFSIIMSQKILYEPANVYGCEYIATIIYNNYANIVPTSDAVNTVQKIFGLLLPDHYVRVFKILSFDKLKRQMTFNMHFTQKNVSSNCLDNFSALWSKLLTVVRKEYNLFTVENLYSRNYCIGELDSHGLHWSHAPVNSTVFPTQPCLSENKSFVTRTCTGNFTDGARWLPPNGRCKAKGDKQISEDLFSLLISNISVPELVNRLYTITTDNNYEDFGSFDVFLLSKIFAKVSQESTPYLQQLLNITSIVNHFDRNTLNRAQQDFDATDEILDSLDTMFSTLTFTNTQPRISLNSDNILLKATDVSLTNTSGVILYKNGELFNLEFLEDENFLPNLVDAATFQAAVLIPGVLRNQIIESKSNNNSVAFAVYIQDALFNSPSSNRTGKVKVSQIFDVLIPGFDEHFIEPITILYKSDIVSEEKSCVHWNFHEVKGYWKGDNSSVETKTGLKCTFWHVTHFALLFIDNDDDLVLSNALDLITDVNCLLSLIGLFFILLTAVLFKRWRTNTGNKILINFVFAIAFQISLLYTSGLVHKYVKVSDLCTIVGAMLHYSIISEFGWMLIVAILQFRRFVEVLGGQPKYIMLKACMVGWILPLFPMLCVLLLDPKSYVRNKVGLCYPTGLSLYLSIWLPVGIIVAINSVIFTYILYSVTTKNTECLIDNKESYYQWRLAVLLFFMLGLTWSFGLLIQLDFGVLFVYLFTFSATLQGFIMFLFFIIFNKNTRVMYLQFMRNCFCSDEFQ